MPGFDTIVGQRLPVQLLRQFIHSGNIPHALLFTGIPGIGKGTIAKIFAMALNCGMGPQNHRDQAAPIEILPCWECVVCKKIIQGHHPDVINIAPEKASLGIDRIRALLAILSMKPFNARHRVVIIDQAQSLTAEAGNALLKALEEPPPGTIIILIAPQKADLLTTIVSRCRSIHFQPLTPGELQQLLHRDSNLADAQSALIAELAGGSLERARLLASHQWQAFREWLLLAMGFVRPNKSESRPIPLALAFAGQMAQHKERIQDLFDILNSWLRDLAVFTYDQKGVFNRDHRSALAQMRSGLSNQAVLNMWEIVQKAQKDIAANGNIRLSLEVMALAMASATANHASSA